MIRFIRPLVFIALLYVCAVAQASFLPHFAIMGQVPNVVFIVFFVVVFFEDYSAFFVTAAAGILLDIFFFPYVGIATGTLFVVWALQKANGYFFKKSYHHRTLAMQFIISFIGCFVVYTLLITVWLFLGGQPVVLGWNLFTSFAYNGILAYGGFLLGKRFLWKGEEKSQLRLF